MWAQYFKNARATAVPAIASCSQKTNLCKVINYQDLSNPISADAIDKAML
jgi:hypothetical protein